LQSELNKVLDNLDEIQQKYHPDWKGSKYVQAQSRGAMLNILKDRITKNEITIPDIVNIKRTGVDPYTQLGMMENIRSGLGKISEAAYKPLAVIGKAEGFFARGGYFNQRWEQLTETYVNQGMSRVDAEQFAAIDAMNETSDKFYDLSARSTLEKNTKNIFWFAPVTGELLYRWSYAIPASQGAWLPGMFLSATRVVNYVQMFKNMGIVKSVMNPVTGKSEDSVVIPGMTSLVNAITGSHLKENVALPLSGIFSHIASPIPSLSLLPAVALNKFIAPHIPAVQGLSHLLSPYADVTVFPSAVRNFFGIFGLKVPDFSPDYIDSSWDRTHDLAIQYAWTDMYNKGDVQPDPTKFGLVSGDKGYTGTPEQEKAYGDAWNAWYGRLQSNSEKNGSGLYMMKTLDSLFVPGSLTYSTKEQRDFASFFDTKIAPQLAPGTPMSDQLQQSLQSWESQHPESLAYSISMGKYTGKSITQQDLIDSSSGFRSLYLSGVKEYMTPEEYSQVLAGMTSKAMLVGRLNATVDNIAGKGPVGKQLTNLLHNWGTRKLAVSNYTTNWNNYLNLHPETSLRGCSWVRAM
jgi:hypothetical protein